MLKFICLFASFLCLLSIHSQVASCPNVDLSQNNLNGWSAAYGYYNSPGANNGIQLNRHTIISSQGTDPNTCGGLSKIPTGHTKSIRLGNSNPGAEAEKISYTVQVTANSNLFVYKYAVVLQDPNHQPSQQPKFEARILNSGGFPIGGGCGTYTVYGGQSGQNFQQCGTTTWLPWTVVGMDLSAYMGQTIQIEFTTWDCSLGAHFGYAYLAAECLPLSIGVDLCNSSQNLTLTAPPGFQTYSWQPGNYSGQQVNISNPNINQTYTCTMTTFSNQGTCSVNLSVQAVPTLVQSNFSTIATCEDDLAQFQSSSTVLYNGQNQGIAQYAWNFGNGTSLIGNHPNPSVVYSQAGTYQVSLISESANGCIDTAIQNISILPLPQINPQFQQNCINQSTPFYLSSNNGIDSLLWNFGDGSSTVSQLQTSHTFASAGTYNLTTIAFASNGCADTLIMPITIYPLPPISAGNDVSICPGDSTTLVASGGVFYQWENPYQQNQWVTPTQSTWFTVTGTDSLGCVAQDSMQVQLYVVDHVQAMNITNICLGDSLQIMATVNGSLSWEMGLINQQYVAPLVGNHSYVVHGTDLNGCLSTDTLEITVFSLPPVNAGNDTLICSGAFFSLNASGAINYTWSNGVNNGTSIPIQSQTTIAVVGIDGQGCANSDSVTIFTDPIPTLNMDITNLSGCAPLETTFMNASTGNTFSQVSWDFGDGNQAIGDSATHTYYDVNCFDVMMQVETTLGCLHSFQQNQIVCTFPVPIANFNMSNAQLTTIYNGGHFNNNSAGATVYQWNFGDFSAESQEENPYHTFPIETEGSYEVMLVAFNEYGCSDTSLQIVHLSEELTFYIPNAFTPDGNQYNNTWKPVFSEGLDPQNYHLLIFNRWGETVWESYNSSVGWDGTFGLKGTAVQDDVYIYNIEFGYKDSAKKERVTGHIVLIK